MWSNDVAASAKDAHNTTLPANTNLASTQIESSQISPKADTAKKVKLSAQFPHGPQALHHQSPLPSQQSVSGLQRRAQLPTYAYRHQKKPLSQSAIAEGVHDRAGGAPVTNTSVLHTKQDLVQRLLIHSANSNAANNTTLLAHSHILLASSP